MSQGTFTLLWSKILFSSIWKESSSTRIVWITMLLLKDRDGIVKAAPSGLASAARVTRKECDKALEIFLSPDGESGSKLNEGRKIEPLPNGGWKIINHEQYQFSSEAKREFWKHIKAAQRAQEDAERNEFERRRQKERRRRLKVAGDEGQKAGARQAINEGLGNLQK